MHEHDEIRPGAQAQSDNRSILRKLVVVSVLMFSFGWALVPLYRKICEVTGINIVTLRDADAERAAKNTQVDTSRTVIVEFDANTRGAWQFRPQVSHLEVHPGELVHVTYDLVNLRERSVAVEGAELEVDSERAAIRSRPDAPVDDRHVRVETAGDGRLDPGLDPPERERRLGGTGCADRDRTSRHRGKSAEKDEGGVREEGPTAHGVTVGIGAPLPVPR